MVATFHGGLNPNLTLHRALNPLLNRNLALTHFLARGCGLAARRRSMRNILSLLALFAGTPASTPWGVRRSQNPASSKP